MKSPTLTLALLLGAAASAPATVIGFGQLGGSNTTVPADLGSNATADGSGFVVTNGTTPNVALSWDAAWDIHTSSWFDGLEAQTVGGGAWDNEGGIARVGQLDAGTHSIGFTVDPGFAVVLESFDFVHQPETAGTSEWSFTLTDSGSNTVWDQAVTLDNTVAAGGAIITVTPGFTGALGEDYTLTLTRTSETYGSNGRHAIDNFSFTQVPEPSAAALLGLGLLGLTARRRR